MGAIVAVIGLELAQTAAGMAGLLPKDGAVVDSNTLIISLTIISHYSLRGRFPWVFIYNSNFDWLFKRVMHCPILWELWTYPCY